MSYHILHITTPGCYLSCDKGFLFCEFKDGSKNKIPFEDIKILVVATHGVAFSNACIAKLLENDIVILHCNNSYKPVGWTAPIDRVVRDKAFQNQITQNIDFETNLWKKIVKQKVINQAENLTEMGCHHNLIRLIEKPLMNEANIAKQYWQNYFATLGNPQKREHQNAESFENGCLNYAYAILCTLLYRSVLVHGLIPQLGIHHCEKYKSIPLVYDLIEPYRAFADFYFYKFTQENEGDYECENIKEWFRYFADCLKNYRLKINDLSYKIIDTVDIYIETIVNAYIKFDANQIFLPKLNEQYLFISKHKNREYDEE